MQTAYFMLLVLAWPIGFPQSDGTSVIRQVPEPASTSGRVDLAKRWAAYEPYDGEGRYAIVQDDGTRGVQGLFVLSSRFGPKPYEYLSKKGGRWQTERVIFKDVDTGATMYRYTNDLWTDQLSYFQGNWSADGKYVVFRRRPGMWESSTSTHGPMAMNADGTNMRNVFREYPMVGNVICSPTEPGVCYAVAGGSKVLAFDIATGRQTRLIREAPGWHMKISPDGKYLMSRGETTRGRGIWIASVDAHEFYEIPVPEAIHDSYRFHPGQKQIMFWYEGKFFEEGFVQCDFDGSHMTKVDVKFDWNHGDFGIDRGVHEGGFITRTAQDTWMPLESLFQQPGVEYYDSPARYNGYVSWQPKDELRAYNTRIIDRPHVSEIHSMSTEPAADFVVNRYRVCYTSLRKSKCLDNPNASPDGTKVLFNSNFLGGNNIFGVVARLPERPVDLQATPTADGVQLTWRPPKHHSEIDGYHLYRSRTSGVGYMPLTIKPVSQTSFTDKTIGIDKDYFYTATAVEHSGLESDLCDEVELYPRNDGRERIFLDVDQARLSPQMWIAFHGLANDLHYVWQRHHEIEGTATLSLGGSLQTKLHAATLWARVKGRNGVKINVSAGESTASISTPSIANWTWIKADSPLKLTGARELVLSSKHFGSAIDCIYLTDDESFDPNEVPRVVAPSVTSPEDIIAAAQSPYSARLAWRPATLQTFHHYNVYCGNTEGFVADQGTLVASPDRPEMIDWALKPGSRYYYRLTCVDRFGNESPASRSTVVETPSIRPVGIEKEPADEILIEVPAKDTYVVWLLLKRVGNDRGYINVRFYHHNTAEMKNNASSRTDSPYSGQLVPVKGGGAWVGDFDGLSDATWLSYGMWGRFTLDRGSYVLRIENKTGSTIEKVRITNALSYKPPGHVNILTGW